MTIILLEVGSNLLRLPTIRQGDLRGLTNCVQAGCAPLFVPMSTEYMDYLVAIGYS